MANLKTLIGVAANGLGSIGTGPASTKRVYRALALVDKGELPAVGASYTLLDSSTVTVSGATLATVVKDLTYRNKARFFPDGSVKGTKENTVNLTTGEIYGDDTVEGTTGEVTEKFGITFRNFYQNVEGFNAIRANSDKYDVALFTNDTAEIYTRATNNTQIYDVMDSADGDNMKARNGSFGIAARGVSGQVVPLDGVYKADLADDLKFTFTVGSLTNLTAGTCSGQYKKYSRTTSSTVSSIPFTVAPSISCITFSLFILTNGVLQPATGATYASINSATGTVTFPSNHVSGETKYVVQVQNEVGVHGEYYLAVTI